MKERIETELAPKAIGPYSQAIKYKNIVYLSGQIPLDPKTMELVSQDIAQQTRQVIHNLAAVCKAAQGDLSSIVKLSIYLIDLNDFAIVNQIMSEFFNEALVARTTLGVAALPRQARIEVDAIACIG